MSPVGTSLLNESLHTLLLVSRCKHRVKNSTFESDSLSKIHLVRCIHGLFRHGNSWTRERGNLFTHLESLSKQLLLRHHPADKPISFRLLCVYHISCENHLHRLSLSNGADQALGATAAWNNSQCDFRLAELCVVGSNHNITHHSELTTTTQRISRHSCNGRLNDLRDFSPIGKHIIHIAVHKVLFCHFFNISTSSKCFLASSNNNRPHIIISIKAPACMCDIC
mmetsp:Transcript_14924/g.22451  ORF Transcript_14924/g.22451 Transcript_14924/m.22451 type:complete len:224 (+) Transcript_14924:115-786(+)